MAIDTLAYYEEHADEFCRSTVNVEFHSMQDKFLDKLKPGAYVLDFGCGSGRDTKYFLEQGYRVDAMDGSKKMCEFASRYTGIKVEHKLFQELDLNERYDGIWACSSILHLNPDELMDVMNKMARALKRNGIFYTSFKYGSFAGWKKGRYFTNMTEKRASELLQQIEGLKIEEQWITSDARPGRRDERWLNLIVRKA